MAFCRVHRSYVRGENKAAYSSRFKFLGGTRGSSGVEFALIAVVFFSIMGALIDLGLIFLINPYVHNIAFRTARQAAVNSSITNQQVKLSEERAAEARIARLLGPLFANPKVEISPNFKPTGTSSPVVMVRVRGFYRYNFLRMIGFKVIEIDRTSAVFQEF